MAVARRKGRTQASAWARAGAAARSRASSDGGRRWRRSAGEVAEASGKAAEGVTGGGGPRGGSWGYLGQSSAKQAARSSGGRGGVRRPRRSAGRLAEGQGQHRQGPGGNAASAWLQPERGREREMEREEKDGSGDGWPAGAQSAAAWEAQQGREEGWRWQGGG
ncbi:heterogeneous nuclear ribonucleoprotein A1-like [Ananas comosus]|uniref:Heterogeneous nuclear ribonucleoprotein A1-like n=1 Tax=Ananas comosus TaxID=4615 RepID=A0A6P5H189_ANACO|nr:heterogeneous nuclear ribonucleoprotein A1-like [Ananas comosus]